MPWPSRTASGIGSGFRMHIVPVSLLIDLQVLLEITPVKLGNVGFVCVVYPLSSVDNAKTISVPDTCGPAPASSSTTQSPTMMSEDYGKL